MQNATVIPNIPTSTVCVVFVINIKIFTNPKGMIIKPTVDPIAIAAEAGQPTSVLVNPNLVLPFLRTAGESDVPNSELITKFKQ